MFVFLPDSMLPCERQDLKTLSIVETKYFAMSTLINSSRLLRSFYSRILLAVAAGGNFLTSRGVELMVWDSMVSSQPLLMETNVFYNRKCMSLSEGYDSVEGWEQKRILKYCGGKDKPSCCLLQCKWFLFLSLWSF